MSTIELAATVMVAIVAATPGILAFIQQRRKSSVDVAKEYEAMAQRQIEQINTLRARLDAMETQIDALECENEALRKVVIEWQAGISLLTNSLVAHDIPVPWTPHTPPPPPRRKTPPQ